MVLGILDLPPAGRPRRRAGDYVDPMEAYGTPPLGNAALSDGRSADDLRRARRRRRLRELPRDDDARTP